MVCGLSSACTPLAGGLQRLKVHLGLRGTGSISLSAGKVDSKGEQRQDPCTVHDGQIKMGRCDLCGVRGPLAPV